MVATPDGQVTELGGRESATTNNKMEIMAAIRALEFLENTPGPISLYTDSVYVINGITKWIWGWRKKGWKTGEGEDVANIDLWKRLSAVVAKRPKEASIEWKFVKGHSGVPGNERCDEIAVALTAGKRIDLYRGPLLKYEFAIYDLPPDVPVPDIKNRPAPKAAHSYLSLVGGRAERHSTWAQCEARVKGVSGAKFKKALDAEDEAKILASWGARLSP